MGKSFKKVLKSNKRNILKNKKTQKLKFKVTEENVVPSKSIDVLNDTSKELSLNNVESIEPEYKKSKLDNENKGANSFEMDVPCETISLSTDTGKMIKSTEKSLNIYNEKPLDNTFNIKRFIKLSHNDDKIIIINKNQSIYFFGLANITVLSGELEILGFKINETKGSFNVYSPRGCALLYLKNITLPNNKTSENALQYINNAMIKNEIHNSSCIVMIKVLDDIRISFIEKYISQQILPVCSSKNCPRIKIEPNSDNFNFIQIGDEWDEIIDAIKDSTKLIIVGGKNVGKSTFLRYAINRLLSKYPLIRVVDLDPGQSEFTIPGCISVVTLNEPLLGCNYTHLKKPDYCLLSNINPANDPSLYLNTVNKLIDYVNDSVQLPTIINFMGYTDGIGLNILCSVINCIQPTDVIELISENDKKNYSIYINPDNVFKNSELLSENNLFCNFNHKRIPSVCSLREKWSLQSRQFREMNVLAYFGNIVNPVTNSLFDESVPLYEIDLNLIEITDLNGNILSPAVINANIIALGVLKRTDNIYFECYGWGIVRGIDVDEGKLVLITPEECNIIEDKITHFILSGILLPPSIYMTVDNFSGDVPYVSLGELCAFGQFTKRSYLSRHRNK